MPVEKKEVDVPTFIPVYFANNSAVVADTYKAELDRVAQCLKNDQELRIQLAGYASNVGNVEYNKALSARRCNAVKQYIESKGVDGKKMEIKPCGIDYDAKQAEKARRVDVIVIEVR